MIHTEAFSSSEGAKGLLSMIPKELLITLVRLHYMASKP